jgi:hypothetical protein
MIEHYTQNQFNLQFLDLQLAAVLSSATVSLWLTPTAFRLHFEQPFGAAQLKQAG